MVKGKHPHGAWPIEGPRDPSKLPWPEGDPFPSGWGPHPHGFNVGDGQCRCQEHCLLGGPPDSLNGPSVPSDAYDMAKLLCDKYYMASPDLEIQEINGE